MKTKRAYTKKNKKYSKKAALVSDAWGWVDPAPDPYGIERLIAILKDAGYNAAREEGVVMVYVTDSLAKYYDEIKEIVEKQGFTNSWGVKLQR